MDETHTSLRAQTVLGPVPADELGITLMHEHLVFDFSDCLQIARTPAEKEMYGESVSIELLGPLRFNPCLLRDNLVHTDTTLSIEEVSAFVAVGGKTIVDPTNASIGRDPLALCQIARATGLNVVMGAGYYYQVSLDNRFAQRSIEDIATEIQRDVIEGVGDTGIRAGLIGEIGTSAPIAPTEEKSLRAAARAQMRTGAPLMVHLDGWGREGHHVLDLIEEQGGDLARTILCHMNPSWFDIEYQASLAQRGAFIEFDMFGINHFYPPDRTSPDEIGPVKAVARHIQTGFLDKLLLSQDVYLKMMFRKFGGYGYAHLLTNLMPYFELAGITQDQLNTIFVDNPRRVLAYL